MRETHGRDVWFITSQHELEALCRELATAPHIGVDTEFERQRTYYAELCLIQVAAGDMVACIDPLAVASLVPLGRVLAHAPAPKILHAARQDLEILYQQGGSLPAPLLDTQIAAALAGHAENCGYADLVRDLLGIELDKSQTRTDWRQRPLTDAQVRYAADDVRYLGTLAERLQARLRELGRDGWLAQECRALATRDCYDPPITVAWQRVKGIATLPVDAFARAVALAAWREATARARNLPRGWIIKDAELLGLARTPPATRQQLARAGHCSAVAQRRYGDDIVATLAAPAIVIEAPEQRRLTAAGRELLKILSARVQDLAQDLDLVPTLLITRRELEILVCGRLPARLAQGWRQGVLDEVIALAARDDTAALCD